MVRVKICGICDAAGAVMAAESGADLLGFHFCTSDRRVTPEEAKDIIEGLAVRPKIVGVFLNQSEDEVRQIADFVDLDLVQLHGSEHPGFDAGKPAIKVLKVRDGAIPGAEDWPDPIMVDSWSADQRGGTGHRAGPCGRRGDRREHLRVRLHHRADELAGLPVDQLPGLGLERRLPLRLGPLSDHQLRRDAHAIRRGLPGTPAIAALAAQPATANIRRKGTGAPAGASKAGNGRPALARCGATRWIWKSARSARTTTR